MRGAWNREGWQPDKRIGFALSLCVLSVLAVLFMWLLSSHMVVPLSDSVDAFRERLIFTAPVTRVARSHVPIPVYVPASVSAPLDPLPPLPAPVAPLWDTGFQDYMDENAAVHLHDKVTESELARALQTPASTPALREDQGFSSIDGRQIARVGDRCAEIHSVQVGPSPTNHVNIAMSVPCPGTYTKTMSYALHEWAEKARPPP